MGLGQTVVARLPGRARARLRRWVLDRFALIYYARGRSTWQRTYWLGTQVLKNPADLWVYQEIIHDVRPDLIIETGTFNGGSARYLASICDEVGRGQIITVDTLARPDLPRHPRIEYVTASSIDPAVVAQLTARAAAVERVLVILDSDHSCQHVTAELKVYAPLVTSGSYVIVEDTNVNGHPVLPNHGPGPFEAVTAFLASDGRFAVDTSREKFLHTFNPNGYLKRVG